MISFKCVFGCCLFNILLYVYINKQTQTIKNNEIMNTSVKLTDLEKVAFTAIVKENAPWIGQENFGYTTIMDLVRVTEISASVLRGVLSSLIQKDILWMMEGFDGNDKWYRCYILKNQENVTYGDIATILANN